MKIGFIGAGKVGTSLGKYFSAFGEKIEGYYSKSFSSAVFSASITSSKPFENLKDLVSACGMIFITVPDGEIKSVYDSIKYFDIRDKIICHCSGSLSSEIFCDVEERGAYGYSLHPLQAISDKENSSSLLKSAVFTLEGSEGRLRELLSFVKKFGNTVKVITSKDKALYHAAAVFVSNLPVALAEIGTDMLMRCGFSREDAQKSLAPLIEGSAKNIALKGPVNALTGPVERCDTQTVLSHLKVINEEEKNIYLLLTDKLISISKIKNPEKDYDSMRDNIRKYYSEV